MHRFGRTALLVVVCAVLAWGTTHAALSKYQEKRKEILAACKAARDKLGVEQQKQVACLTPEIALVSPVVASPGQVVEVAVTGRFPAETRFLFESDSVEVVKESAAANSYRATIKVAPGGGPEALDVVAFIPVCCKSARASGAVAIGGNFEWDLKAGNGWIVKARPAAPAAGGRSAELAYKLEFYRGSETAPFARRTATLYPAQSDPPSYRFSISEQDESSSMGAQGEMAALFQQMADPKLSDAAREKLMQRLEAVQANMSKELAKMSDPAYMKQQQAQQEEFGCTAINLDSRNGALTGNMICGQKAGRDIKLTGTMTYRGK
jgi:hypothetical protein